MGVDYGTVGGDAGLELSFVGRDKVGWAFTLTAPADNLVRLPKLLGALA